MPKEQAIKTIESLDKRKIYKIIAMVPNKLIARQYKRYVNEKKEAKHKNSYAKEVDNLWKEATGKAIEPAPNNERDS